MARAVGLEPRRRWVLVTAMKLKRETRMGKVGAREVGVVRGTVGVRAKGAWMGMHRGVGLAARLY
jgi:hypothetical protein